MVNPGGYWRHVAPPELDEADAVDVEEDADPSDVLVDPWVGMAEVEDGALETEHAAGVGKAEPVTPVGLDPEADGLTPGHPLRQF